MEITGILMRQLSEKTGVSPRNGNQWRMVEFLLEIPGNYPTNLVVQVMDGQQSRIARFQQLIGKTVKVSFDLDAHEWNGKWFNDVKAWGIMEYVPKQQQAPIGQTDTQQQDGGTGAAPEAQPAGTGTAPQSQEGGKSDDLPF